MNSSQRRLRYVVLLYAAGATRVLSYVAYLMVVQHEEWELRSYGNRWAFRDVPTRRGSIRDRRGRVLERHSGEFWRQLFGSRRHQGWRFNRCGLVD